MVDGMAAGILTSAMEPSLRERKKAATRLALHRATVELAGARGLDAVTVDAIADHANVSRRTFSNYFANKEEALLYGDRLRYDRLLETLRNRPARETAWQALSRSVHELIAGVDQVDPVRLAQLRLVRSHPSLAAYQLSMQYTVERDLADELTARAARLSGAVEAVDEVTARLRARVTAGAFLAAVRAAMAIWVDEQQNLELGAVVDAALRTACERLR
jgi:AcrR family transcriptional regulator